MSHFDAQFLTRLQAAADDLAADARLLAKRQHDQVEDEWSAHQHLFHLLANEEVFQERIRLTATGNRPRLQRWDSEGHMAKHYSPERDLAELADAFAASRRTTVELFAALPVDGWWLTATWPDGREVDLAWMAEKVRWHVLDHHAFLLDLHGELYPIQAGRSWEG